MHFYLAQLVGTGTEEDPFRPPVSGQAYTMVDLRPLSSEATGYVVVAVETQDAGIGEYLGTDLTVVSNQILNRVRQVFGVAIPNGSTIAQALAILLTTEAAEDGTRSKPLKPRRHVRPDGVVVNRYELFLGGTLVWSQETPILEGSAVYTETFNKANSSTLGPVQTWIEAQGNAEIYNNAVRAVGQGTVSIYLDALMATPDHRVEVDVHINPARNGMPGVLVRVNRQSHNRYKIEMGRTNSVLIFAHDGSTQTQIASFTPSNHPTDFRLAGEANGSTLRVYRNNVLIGQVTDTSLPLSTGVGLQLHTATSEPDNAENEQWLDNFYAGDVEREKVLSGSIATSGRLVRQARKAFAGSITATGVATAVRVVMQLFTGSITATGALTRGLVRLFSGSITATGLVVKRSLKTTTGGATPTATIDFTPRKVLTGSITATGTFVAQFLGRLFGRPGIVAMSVRLAGEVRSRLRRG